MPREIKYKVHDRATGKIYFAGAIDWDVNMKPITVNCVDGPKLYQLNETHGFDLIQFTGLHDKNGKEVYEGDILWCGEYNRKNGHKLVSTVGWQGNRLPIGFTGITEDMYDEPTNYYSQAPLFEVIGNVYENHELLNE